MINDTVYKIKKTNLEAAIKGQIKNRGKRVKGVLVFYSCECFFVLRDNECYVSYLLLF